MAPYAQTLAAPVMKITGALRAVNRIVALACGIALLVAVAMILMEVAGRRWPWLRIGGADELSGYVMAGLATWGFAYALVERAHVRIDLLYVKLPAPGRAWLDIVAMASVAFVAVLVAYYAYDVLGKSLARGSRSNTPLAIQLWIPQAIWFAGWVWLAVTSTVLLACVLLMTFARRWAQVADLAGVTSETGEAV
jgi:TRAP-type C4-dicarboxylate transport system permease small subunit